MPLPSSPYLQPQLQRPKIGPDLEPMPIQNPMPLRFPSPVPLQEDRSIGDAVGNVGAALLQRRKLAFPLPTKINPVHELGHSGGVSAPIGNMPSLIK